MARGIAIAGTPADNGMSTMELTIALILALLRKIPQVNLRMREESWPAIAGNTLAGKTVGVLGFGRIGREVARILNAFGGTRIIAYSRTLTAERAAEVGAESVSFETLLKESDILTIHIQSTAETRGIIGEREFALMKRGALLVNTARGAIVHEAALVEALRNGTIAGAALDVYEHEPAVDPGLRELDNAVLVPHLGSATVETRTAMAELAARNVVAVLAGQPPLTPVT